MRHLVIEHNVHGMWFALLTRLGMTPGFPFHLLKRNVRPRARDLLEAVVVPGGDVRLQIELERKAGRINGAFAVSSGPV
mgnify:CR=1 FL=1